MLVKIIALLLMNLSWSNSEIFKRRGEFIPPLSVVDIEELNQSLFSDLKLQNAGLEKVKYYLINGETELAKYYLNKLAHQQTKLKPIIFRYLGMVSFIEGKFQKSLEYLSLKDLQNVPHFSKICLLKVLNSIVLNKKYGLLENWQRCRMENSKSLSLESIEWADILVEMKLNPKPGLTRKPFRGLKLVTMDNAQLKILLKLALFLNQEELIESQIYELDLIQFQDPEIREILGMILFRLGSFARSYRFIEDLNSPNAENIKGNLYILRGKYELAYAQFKLALQSKQNSQNAMERILPLAWVLEDWEEGAKISQQINASPQTQVHKMTLNAAFQTQKSDWAKAQDILDTISRESRRGSEIDVTQLKSFVSLMRNQPQDVKKNAFLSCQQNDLINCWLSMQLAQWDAFTLTIRRDEKIFQDRDWQKLSQGDINSPLQETVYVDQRNIEELDEKKNQLLPQK